MTHGLLFMLVMLNVGLGSLLWSASSALFGLVLPARWKAPVGRFSAMLWCRWLTWVMEATGQVRCDLSALDALRADGPLVIACNHPSLIDALLLVSRLPRVTCIVKAGLWRNPFWGGGMRLAGYIRNDAPHRLLRAAIDRLHEPGRQQLLIFPEGTRSAEGGIGTFRPGFAAIAKRAGVPVQAVFITVNSPFLGKGWPLFRRPKLPLVYTARLGPRLCVETDAQAFSRSLEACFRQALARPDRADAP